jgi:small-conductance mechanosensitive channel/CRP-like cAMP-binding protein
MTDPAAWLPLATTDLLHEVLGIAERGSGLLAALVTLIAVLFLRLLLPTEQRSRGKITLIFLGISLALHTASYVSDAAGATVAVGSLSFLAVLLQSFAMTGVARMLLFDIALGRVRSFRVPVILQDLLQAAAFLVIFFGIMRSRGVNLLSLITTSAVLTAVIGLALQSTIANLFAGLSIQLDRTIGVGDWIQVGSRVGRVQQIKWRSTSVVTRDGDTVIVPNGELLRGEILNLSKPTSSHRMTINVGFHYRHPPNEVKRVLVDALRGAPGVLAQPTPDCLPVDFSDSAVTYAVRYWINDLARQDEIEGEARTRIWYASRRADLEIPFPIRTVFKTEVTEAQLTREQELDFLERVAALARVDLFAPLEDHDREALARGMKRVRFAAGEAIIRQGDAGDSLFLIQDGKVAVRLAVEGVEREVATLATGDFFGEMSLFTGEPRKATCAADTDVTCYLLEHRSFRSVLEAKPKVAEDISAILGIRQTALEGEREGLSAEARARRAAETSSRVLARIKNFFHLG